MRRPSGRTLAAVIAERAAERPSAPAIFHGDRVVDYAELAGSAGQAARGLVALGVVPGERVGVLLGNEPRWVEMAAAASAVGATLVPLNTWYKEAELAWTVEHCGLAVIVTAARFLRADYRAMFASLVPELATPPRFPLTAARFPDLRAVVFCDGDPPPGGLGWDDFLKSGEAMGGAAPDAGAVDPETGAYILYTSGSSAEPKGVVLNHRGVVENGFDLGQRRAILADDRVWIGTPLFYALGATNALPAAFTAGASVVLQGHFEAGAAIEAIERTEATVYYATGNISRAILDHPEYRQARIGSLKKGNAGLSAAYKRMTLVDMGITGAVPAYGLTETYGNATVGFPDDPLETKLRANGTPLPGMEVVIVDPETKEPLAAGATGLVLVRGHTTPGYFANPEETAKALRPDGFFDTGDLGFFDETGGLVFHSRLKDVIKSGGINISPVEIEQLLTGHPDVRDAFVVGVPDPMKGELIVAFVDSFRPLTEEAVRDYVRERAASFKVPHHILFRSEDQLPRLATGKVAKHRLAAEARRELGCE